MEKLNYIVHAQQMYRLPEGFHAVKNRFSYEVYDDRGKNVTSKIMGGSQHGEMIILTNNGIHKLELIENAVK